MIAEIKYKDSVNSESDDIKDIDGNVISGRVVNWSTPSRKFKEERIQPKFLAPTITTDTWNGKEFDIQHETHDSYYFEIFVKESELTELVKIKSCKHIEIVQYNDTGTIINVNYILDTTKSDYIQIDEPERADTTSGWKVPITFRTNRTIINKGETTEFNNSIAFNYGLGWNLDYNQEIPANRLTKLSASSFAALNANILTKYKRVNNTWSQDGVSFALPTWADGGDVAGLDSNNVVVVGGSDTNIAKYTFKSGVWSLTGNIYNLVNATSDQRVTSLTESIIVASNGTTHRIQAYQFDNNNWATLGNSHSAPLNDICSLTESKIVVASTEDDEMYSYNFNGVDFTFGEFIIPGISGTVSITRINDTTIALIDSGSGIMRNYTINGSWVLATGGVAVTGAGTIVESLTENQVYVAATSSGIYNLDSYLYYTDFDVIDYSRDVEDLLVPWSDGLEKVAQTRYKNGLQYLKYFTTDEYYDFVKQLKIAPIIEINSTVVTDALVEKTQIGENYWRVVVSGISEEGTYNIDLGANETNKLELIAGTTATHYSDYEVLDTVIGNPEILYIDWYDETKRKIQSVDKTGLSFTLFIDESNLNDFVTNFRKSTSIEINDIPITEAEFTPENITPELIKIVVTGVSSVDLNNFDVSPLSTYNLRIIDGTPTTYNFYTDYPPERISESPDIDSVENQTGIKTPVKTISREVKEFRTYLNETDAFNLKKRFELFGTVTLDGVPVYESRDVSPEKIGVDLYEVKVNLLLDANTN